MKIPEIPNLTILTEEQISGPNRLKIFDVIGKEAAVSDTAILRGAYVSSNYHVHGNNTLSGRTGWYWTKTSGGRENVRAVSSFGGSSFDSYCDRRYLGSRPALPSSFILSIFPNLTKGEDGLERVKLGYYSGQALEEEMQVMLENMYKAGTLSILGKGCTFDGRKYDEYDKDFLPEDQMYYGYEGTVYARVRANSYYDGKTFTLSNGEDYKDNDYVWTKVEPFELIRHPEDDWFVAEKIIIAGVKFKKKNGFYDGNFNNTELKWYFDEYLSKDLVNPIVYNYIENYSKEKEQEKKQTVNNFIYKDEDGKVIKKVRVKVKIGKKS